MEHGANFLDSTLEGMSRVIRALSWDKVNCCSVAHFGALLVLVGGAEERGPKAWTEETLASLFCLGNMPVDR